MYLVGLQLDEDSRSESRSSRLAVVLALLGAVAARLLVLFGFTSARSEPASDSNRSGAESVGLLGVRKSFGYYDLERRI